MYVIKKLLKFCERLKLSKLFKTKYIKIILLNNYNDSQSNIPPKNLLVYYQCKCGHKRVWSSILISDCDGCYKCKTTLAPSLSFHKQLIAHDFITKYDENTGQPYKICQKCWKKHNDIVNEIKEIIKESKAANEKTTD